MIQRDYLMAFDRNLVVILPSGQRCDAYGHARAWPIQTPHLDAMAESGVDLPAVSVSTATGPSMLSLLTGLHVRQHGMLDEGSPSPKIGGWAKQFTEAGYHVAGVGRVGLMKDHLYQACITDDLSVINTGCPYLKYASQRGITDQVAGQRTQRLRSGPFELNGAAFDSPSDDIDGFIADQAVGLLEKLPRDRPWVLVVSLTGPGNYLPAPRKFMEKINPADLMSGFVPADLKKIDRYAQLPFPRLMLQNLTPQRIANIRRHYLARILMVDEMVGRLRQMIEFTGQSDRTWMTMCSDHGMMLGEHGLVGHRAMLGGAVYVPLWVLPPEPLQRIAKDDTKPVAANQLLSTTDFAATLCAITGVDAPPGCAGMSALPALQDAEVGRDAVLSEYGTRLMLETMSHRVIFDVESDEPLALFDLINDPDERCDLIDTVQAWNLIDVLRLHLAGALMPLRPVRTG